jgi:hypothetical protein
MTTTSPITHGFERIDDFLAVQGLRPSLEAVLNLQAAVGIDDDTRRVFRDRVEALGYLDDAGPILLGVLLALLSTEAR